MTLLLACLVLVAGFCVGAQQILLGPNAVNYPSARPLTRVLMFAWAGALMLRGAHLLIGVIVGEPETIPASGIFAGVMLALVQLSLFWNLINRRLPARLYV